MPEDRSARPDPTDLGRVVDTAALKGLSHPLRLRLLIALERRRRGTASELAAELGESSGATSYHLRQLHRHGFIEEVPGAGTARERVWQPVTGGWSLPVRELAAVPGARHALDQVTRTMFRASADQFEAFFGALDRWPAQWQDAAQRIDWHFELNADQLRAMNREILLVFGKYKEMAPGPGARQVVAEAISYPTGEPPTTDPDGRAAE